MPEKTRIFVDMDGTLCGWRSGADMNELLRPGFFSEMECQVNVAEAVNLLAGADDVEVYILSAVLAESTTATAEKNAWLDENLIMVPVERRIFCHCGTPKSEAIEGGIRSTDILLDDYSRNLHEWANSEAHAVKVYNGINGSHGSWHGDAVVSTMSPMDIVRYIRQSIAIYAANHAVRTNHM